MVGTTNPRRGATVRVGLITRGDRGGLAAQTYDFYKHVKPDKVMLVNIDVYTHQTTDESKYPGAYIVRNYPTTVEWNEWLTDLDVVFTVECPYDHELYRIARERGIKTIEQHNFEFQAFHQSPEFPKPDLILSPSSWRQDEVIWAPVKYLHVPVDREKFPFKGKIHAKTFIHIAGHRTFNDRNGTVILLEALPYIKSDIKIKLFTQDELPRPYTDSKLEIIREDFPDNASLYKEGDVLILPRRYGGLSLQMNEALSCGMPVISLDIAPQNEFLPEHWLIPATLKEQTMVKTMIDVYDADPQVLAAKIDEFADSLIMVDSAIADAISSEKSWTVMLPKYIQLMEELCLA